MGEGATAPAERRSRNYVVVSADTHASPDSLDHFLSYVDPGHREAVAAFGDMSSLAISMFGGFDPGEVDESDPVRATAARRLAGMGVDTDAAAELAGPLRHGLGGPRRRRRPAARGARGAGDPRRGDPARARSWPGACRRPCTWVRRRTRGSRWCGRPCTATCAGWPTSAPPPRGGGPAACRSTSTTWTGPWRRWRGRGPTGIFGGVMLPAMSVTSRLPGYADDYYDPFWSACEEHQMVVNLHTGASGSATDTKFLYDAEHGGMLGPLRGVRVHPPPAVVHDLRGRLRPPPRPQGGGHGERRAVAALAHPGHGVVLRHARRRTGPLLPQDAARATTSRSTSSSAARS